MTVPIQRADATEDHTSHLHYRFRNQISALRDILLLTVRYGFNSWMVLDNQENGKPTFLSISSRVLSSISALNV